MNSVKVTITDRDTKKVLFEYMIKEVDEKVRFDVMPYGHDGDLQIHVDAVGKSPLQHLEGFCDIEVSITPVGDAP